MHNIKKHGPNIGFNELTNYILRSVNKPNYSVLSSLHDRINNIERPLYFRVL